MKISKLHIILACSVSALSANSYAWHNELPKGGFNICNKTGKDVKMELDHFRNVKWQVPDGSGWNTKRDYIIKNNECGLLQVTTDWGGANELTKLYVGVKPADGSNSGHVGFDIRSYTKDEHERRGADSNQLNSWNAMSYQSSGNWTAEALVNKSVSYTKEDVCRREWDHICVRWDEKFHKNENGSGLLDLAVYGTGGGSSLFTAPEDIQEIDIITKNNPSNLPEQKLGYTVFTLFNNKLASSSKASALENLKGSSINWGNYPQAKLCKVYGIAIDSQKTKVINEKTSSVSTAESSPIFFNVTPFDNSDPVNSITRTTPAYSEAITELRSATLNKGWKWGVGAKIGAKFNVLAKEGSWEISTNYEYNEGTSDTYSKSETRTYILPSQNIVIPPRKHVDVQAKIERTTVTSEFSFDYEIPNPTIRADVALDGNCNGKIEPARINTYNLLTHINPNDLIEGVSANRGKNTILLNGKGALKGETGYKFTLKETWSDYVPSGKLKSATQSKVTMVTKDIPLNSSKTLDTKNATVNPFNK